MTAVDWVWNGEDERWQFVFKRQDYYIKTFWGASWRKWFEYEVDVSVAGDASGQDDSLCAIASAYAARIEEIAEAIARYLPRRAINIYNGQVPHNVVHPEDINIQPYEITIPDSTQPKRVHVFVDTSYPDPYYTYEIIFEDMKIVEAVGEVL